MRRLPVNPSSCALLPQVAGLTCRRCCRPDEDCAQEVVDLIDSCLEADSRLRPSAKDLVVALEQLCSQQA